MVSNGSIEVLIVKGHSVNELNVVGLCARPLCSLCPPTMDRAKLVRRRQRLRLEVQDTVRKEGKENGSGSTQRVKAASKPTAGADKLAKATASAHNPALMVRQILQSAEYGEAPAFLQPVGKQELVSQLVAVAGYASDVRGYERLDQ